MPDATMTLHRAFDELYRPLRLRGKSPRTTMLYGCCIRSFGRWLGRDPVLADLDDLVVSRYLEHRATQVAPLTCERERVQLCALSRLLAERRVIEFPLTVQAGRLPERVPEAWSLEEVGRLMAAGRRAKGATPDGIPFGELFGTLLPLLWQSGERIWAVMAARREDYRRPHLLLRAEARKGSKRDRLYTLSGETCDRIEALLAHGRDEIFPWSQSKGMLWYHFRRVMQDAGLRGDTKRLGFHQIRRTACTHYAASGGDPRWFLDHENLRTTTKWYLDPRYTDRHAKPCDVLPGIQELVDAGAAAG